MTKASEQAHALWPYLLPLVQRVAINGVNGLTVSGASGGGGGAPSPHTMTSDHHTGPISSLQGPQFLLLDGSRALSGHLSVNAGITIDGVDLSAHVADPDAHHNRVTVGAGLTLATQHIVVNQAYDFAWTGIHSFSQDPQLSANLDFVGADRSITGTGDITISPADDLFLDPTGDVWLSAGGVLFFEDDQEMRSIAFSDLVTGIQGFRWWERSDAVNYWQLTMGALKVDELYARVFVADEVRIDRGEEYWSKSFGIVETDFVMPALAATVDVWFEDAPALLGANLFSAGDWLLMRIIDWGVGLLIMKAWFQVTSLQASDTVNDRQQWRLTRKKFGTTGVTVKKGNVMLDAGVVGQGWLHLSALSQDGGPFFQVGDFTSIIADEPQFTNRVRMGNLDGTVDYSSGDEWGFAAGNNLGIGPDAGFSGLTADATTGLRLFNTDMYLYTGSDLALSIKRAEGIRIKGQPAAFAALYSYEFRNTADVELGGVYLRYTDSGTDTNEISMRALGSAGVRPYASLLSDSAVASSPAGDPLVLIQANNTNSGTIANITMDVTPTAGTIVFGATNYVQTNPEFRTNYVRPQGDNTHDIGSASFRYRAIYADQVVVSGAISGASIGGQTWTYPGNMIIDAVSGSNTTLSLTNSGAGRADLDIDRNITVGGTVDGVDISVHAVNANAHHDQATAGDGIAVTVQSIAVNSTVARTTIDMIAGAGLTGGGTLAANRTFTVGAGDGISVAADAVAVDSSVARTTIDMIAGAGLTGGGTLAASRTFAVGAGDGISVAADAVAVDATVARTTTDMIAGAGLTGGGTLAASRTFAVGAGDGIAVAADAVAVNSTVVRTTRSLIAGFGLIGLGTLEDDRTVAVGAGVGITANADDVAVNQNFAPTWTGMHTFDVDPQLAANLDFIGGARSITTASTDNLTIAPGGDLILSPVGVNVLPTGSVLVDMGDYNRKWRTLYASELYVETLVATDVMATIGGRVMVAPTTTLIADMTFTQLTIDVKHEIFDSGDYIFLQTAPGGIAQTEAMKVTSAHTVITGGYRYTVTRNLNGSTPGVATEAAGSNVWLSGDAVVHLGGVVGEGYIDLTSTQTVHSHLGPTITIYSRTATTLWNDVKPVVTMGNLRSFVDYSADEFGFAVGNDLTLDAATGFSGATVDRVDGLRLFNTRLEWIDSGSDSFTMAVNPSSTGIRIAEGGDTLLDLKSNQAEFSGQVFANGGLQVVGAILVGAGGLDFSLAAGGGSALTQYKVGTWTPVITSSNGNFTTSYTAQIGRYTRIGDVVHYYINIVINSISAAGTGNLAVSLPSATETYSPAAVYMAALNFSTTPISVVFVCVSGQAYGNIYGIADDAGSEILQITALANGDQITIQGAYFDTA